MADFAVPCKVCGGYYPGDCFRDGCKVPSCTCDGCLIHFNGVIDSRDTQRTHIFGGRDSAGYAQCSRKCWCIKGQQECKCSPVEVCDSCLLKEEQWGVDE